MLAFAYHLKFLLNIKGESVLSVTLAGSYLVRMASSSLDRVPILTQLAPTLHLQVPT